MTEVEMYLRMSSGTVHLVKPGRGYTLCGMWLNRRYEQVAEVTANHEECGICRRLLNRGEGTNR